MSHVTSARQAIEAALSCGRSGDVIREQNNVYGGAVNIASRITGLSARARCSSPTTVRSLARTSSDVLFADRGEFVAKGFEEPVRVFEVT